jgi:23S rRNA C2498 (ribose-2'-O)-methylase RlmM
MNSQFLFFITNIGNEALLKEEIKCFYPLLTPAYMRKGFMTFKNTGRNLNLTEIAKLEFCFARAWGECLGKNLNSPLANFKHILSENEIWEGRFDLKTRDFKLAFFDTLTIPAEAPSRAYMKIKEVATFFDLPLKVGDVAVELGSAPGGATYYLLERGLKVYGVDPAEMASICLKHPNFTHMHKSVQTITPQDFKHTKIDWALVDMNLSPEQSVNETVRVLSGLNLNALIFTLKMTQPKFIKRIYKDIEKLKSIGFSKAYCAQMPCHRQEFTVLLQN